MKFKCYCCGRQLSATFSKPKAYVTCHFCRQGRWYDKLEVESRWDARFSMTNTYVCLTHSWSHDELPCPWPEHRHGSQWRVRRHVPNNLYMKFDPGTRIKIDEVTYDAVQLLGGRSGWCWKHDDEVVMVHDGRAQSVNAHEMSSSNYDHKFGGARSWQEAMERAKQMMSRLVIEREFDLVPLEDEHTKLLERTASMTDEEAFDEIEKAEMEGFDPLTLTFDDLLGW